jgi:hypothetical protein
VEIVLRPAISVDKYLQVKIDDDRTCGFHSELFRIAQSWRTDREDRTDMGAVRWHRRRTQCPG